ncbi:hypothetical protein HEP87_62075 [Streptomyces sp. S1D4-11]
MAEARICWAPYTLPTWRESAGSRTVSRPPPPTRAITGTPAAVKRPTVSAIRSTRAFSTTGRGANRQSAMGSRTVAAAHCSQVSCATASGISACRRLVRSRSH